MYYPAISFSEVSRVKIKGLKQFLKIKHSSYLQDISKMNIDNEINISIVLILANISKFILIFSRFNNGVLLMDNY